jgi:hypothetical protein
MARTLKVAFRDLASRVTFSTPPIFGVSASWTPSEPERNHIRRLIHFLEDRRVLFVPYHLEEVQEVNHSVGEIRQQLTATLQALPEKSYAAASIKAMRSASRSFMTGPREEFRHLSGWDRRPWDHRRGGGRDGGPSFFMALGELRATFGMHLHALAVAYGIDVEPELAAIMPTDAGADEQQE